MILRVVCASANRDKAAEIAAILAETLPDLELVPRPDGVPDVEETADTLEGNARLKARALCAATGLPAVADDTGLEVDALGGAPGVLTARFAGAGATYDDNVRLLLDRLDGVAAPERRARFVTVALTCFPDGREAIAFGDVGGVITSEPRGSGGFGYDPVFAPDGAQGRTFAEMSAAEKHERSHRGRAFRRLAEEVRAVRATQSEAVRQRD
jgi:XTP/dITP diphosphohydrolase